MRYNELWDAMVNLRESEPEDFQNALRKKIREHVYQALCHHWEPCWKQEEDYPKRITFTEKIIDEDRITFELGLKYVKCYIEVDGEVQSLKEPLSCWWKISIKAFSILRRMQIERTEKCCG